MTDLEKLKTDMDTKRAAVRDAYAALDAAYDAACDARDAHTAARATPAPARPLIAAEWQPIETAPHDQHFIAAIEVQSSVAPTRWQMDVVFIDGETGELGYDCDFGWSIGDYSHWQPLPAPPTAIKETIR